MKAAAFGGSLCWRVAIATALATALCMTVAGAIVDITYGLRLREDLVHSLEMDSAFLTHPEDKDGVLSFEIEPDEHLEFSAGVRSRYFQIWNDRGTVTARSESLADGNLVTPRPPADGPRQIVDLRLPNGRAGLAVIWHFAVQDEHNDTKPAQRFTIAVAQDTESMEDAREALGIILLWVGIGASMVGAGTVALVARHTMRPLGSLAAAIVQRADRPGETLNITGVPSELRPVVATLESVISQLQDGIQRERQFTADAAHELRTPLAAQRLLLEIDHQTSSADANTHEIMTLTLQMQALVDSLLNLTRLEAGQYPVAKVPCAIGTLIRECWRVQADAAATKSQQVTLLDGAGPTIATDTVLLRQLLTNLMDNAVEYGDVGGRITVACESANEQITVTVANTGCTLAPHEVQRVFDRFWRGDVARTSTARHAGLGLPLCCRLAVALGGGLSVTVNADIFTATLRLPDEKPSDKLNPSGVISS